jgi:mRNA-degrading endonuclease YafQ of YafQ-DinJ toxin-antitoxin module|tara:strand:- start:7 stop:279 length:273 start_codon:yes stop_codon:yes gene_type:complete
MGMEIRRIRYSTHFQRAFKKLPPDLKPQIREREVLFKNNCFDPRLDTHKLTGKLKNFWSFSITYKHRILFAFEGEGEVGFIDVGDHSIYR